jgi:hypothetical protein
MKKYEPDYSLYIFQHIVGIFFVARNRLSERKWFFLNSYTTPFGLIFLYQTGFLYRIPEFKSIPFKLGIMKFLKILAGQQ